MLPEYGTDALKHVGVLRLHKILFIYIYIYLYIYTYIYIFIYI